MDLRYVILYVDDAVAATEFYQKAFGLPVRFIHESGMYAEMESGQTILSFSKHEMLKMNTGIDSHRGTKNSFEIAFTTTDVQGAFTQALSAGAREIAKPGKKPWGQTVAYVQDPFGTIIEICTPILG